MLSETEEDLTPLQEINDAPKLVLNLNPTSEMKEKVNSTIEDSAQDQKVISDENKGEGEGAKEQLSKDHNYVIENLDERKDAVGLQGVGQNLANEETSIQQNGQKVNPPNPLNPNPIIPKPETPPPPEPSITSDDDSTEEERYIEDEDFPEIMTPEYFSEHLIIKTKTFRAFLGLDKQRNTRKI